MQHARLRFGRLQSRHAVVKKINARRHDQAVVSQRATFFQVNRLHHRVDHAHFVAHQVHAVARLQLSIVARELLHLHDTSQYTVGQRAGNELRLALDQGDLDIRAPQAHILGGSCSRVSSANYHNPAHRLACGNARAADSSG